MQVRNQPVFNRRSTRIVIDKLGRRVPHADGSLISAPACRCRITPSDFMSSDRMVLRAEDTIRKLQQLDVFRVPCAASHHQRVTCACG
jgi:hypothetical protein